MKRERSRAREKRPRAAGRSSASPALSATAPSPGRQRLFRLLAVFVLPLFVLAGVELFLRILGLGFDPHFFRPATIGGKQCLVASDEFGLQFFPRKLARIPPPAVMAATKAPDTFRVFILGESAALGDPRPNYGAGCYLEVLLAERFPQARFEVINTAVTAINSHAILPIAEECARHAGDLWITYMGNNEMVGPFGAATVFGPRAPPVWLVRAQLQLRRLRLGQVLLQASQKLHGAHRTPAGWHGMEMFVQNQVAPDDPGKQRVYRNFERNLADILKLGLDSGASIILSTVAVNLKDCPPFGSVAGRDLSPGERAAYDQLCQDASAAQAQGRLAEAHSDYERATRTCPHSAEAQFQLATCLLLLTNTAAARTHFRQAVDTDTLPFRADSPINETIRAMARKFASDPVRSADISARHSAELPPGAQRNARAAQAVAREPLALCDAAEALSAASPDGIPGEELFYEHVHLNPTGNHALALAWAAQVEKCLSPELKRGARASWLSQAECEQWLALTDWNRLSILEEILQRVQQPPFTGQSGHAQRVARLQRELDELRQHLTNEAAARASNTYSQALRRAPENFRLHENYAEFLDARHELKLAIAERKKVCELIPCSYFPFYALGLDLKEAGELAEAREAFLQAASLKPEQGEVRLELGITSARQGQWEQARRELEAARRLSPEEPQAALFLGEVLWKLDRRSEAVSSLRQAIQLAPSDWQPHYRLASDLAQQGQLAGAAAEYQEAVRLNPASVKARLGLATVLLNLSRQPEASQQLDEALRLEPNNQAALEFRRKLRGL